MPVLNASATPGVARWSADGDGLVLGSGGNDRGTGAVDLQTVRALDTQVASGDYSMLLGGRNSTASGNFSLAGGDGATAAALNSIAFGDGATVNAAATDAVAIGTIANVSANGADAIALGNAYADGEYAIVIGGSNARAAYGIAIGTNCVAGNDAADPYATAIGWGASVTREYGIAIGYGNVNATGKGAIAIGAGDCTSTNFYSVAIGNSVYSDGDGAVCIGGVLSQSSAPYSCTLGGNYALTDHPSSVAFAGQHWDHAGPGLSQGQLIHQDEKTTDGSTKTLVSVEQTGVGLTATTCLAIQGVVTAWNSTDSTSSSWFITALIQRDGANNTTLVGQSGNGKANAATGAITNDAGAATLEVACAADDVNETIDINVTGVAGKTIRWSAALLVSRAGT